MQFGPEEASGLTVPPDAGPSGSRRIAGPRLYNLRQMRKLNVLLGGDGRLEQPRRQRPEHPLLAADRVLPLRERLGDRKGRAAVRAGSTSEEVPQPGSDLITAVGSG